MSGMETTFILWTWNEAMGIWDYHAKYALKEMAEKQASKLPRKTTITPLMLPLVPT